MRSKNRSAQVMLEYLVMAMIVLAAIIYGGPILVNSIGAHFRIAEDNANDAFIETPQQAAAETCACYPESSNASTWPTVGGCGEQGCGPLEQMRQRQCPGCSQATQSSCATSRNCCSPAVKGGCGSVEPTLSSTLCASREAGGGRCLDANGGVRGCLSTEISSTAACGEGITKYTCVSDSTCVAACVSTVWTPDPSTGCVGSTVHQTGNCGNTQDVPGTMAPVCPPATSVMCGSAITPTNGCVGTCPGTGGTMCPIGYECKNNSCVKKCWNLLQTTDTGFVREGDRQGSKGCDSTIKDDGYPPCGPFPGCPTNCNNAQMQTTGTKKGQDSCYTRGAFGVKVAHGRNRWICADLDYANKCYRDACTSSNFSKVKDGWVNESGQCVK